MSKNKKYVFPFVILDPIDRETGNFFFACKPTHRVLEAKGGIIDYNKIHLGYHYFFDVRELRRWYQSEVLDKQRFHCVKGKNGCLGYLVPIAILRNELPQGAMSERVDEIAPSFFPDDEPDLDDIPF